jgi:hypothetical protein
MKPGKNPRSVEARRAGGPAKRRLEMQCPLKVGDVPYCCPEGLLVVEIGTVPPLIEIWNGLGGVQDGLPGSAEIGSDPSKCCSPPAARGKSTGNLI